MACNPHEGCDELPSVSGTPDVILLVLEPLLRPLFDLSPSFSLILFQPVLCALIARWSVPGEALNAQSEVGGVVGGVMGSSRGDPMLSVSSVKPSSGESTDGEPEWWPESPRWSPKSGKKLVFGDRLASSRLPEAESCEICSFVRPCRPEWVSSAADSS